MERTQLDPELSWSDFTAMCDEAVRLAKLTNPANEKQLRYAVEEAIAERIAERDRRLGRIF